MRFKCDFLAFFLANFSIPLVMDQAVLGIPAITALIPSPSWGRRRRRRRRRFGGMIDWGFPSRLSFLCLFEVQRDNGMAVTKLDQVSSSTNRFGHLNMNHFHHLVTKSHVLNVQRFKVDGATCLSLVLDFTQQIGHAIAHHGAACHVGVHVQGSCRFPHHRSKRHIQVGETPITTHTQL